MSERTVKEFTGTHMLLVIVSFFAVIIAVNMLLLYFANISWTGLVTKSAYNDSQNYNHVLADARRQAAMGWTSKLTDKDDQLVIAITDKSGALVHGLKVTATIGRTTNENEDRQLVFTETPKGYHAAPKLALGRWQVDMHTKSDTGQSYRQIFRFIVKPKA